MISAKPQALQMDFNFIAALALVKLIDSPMPKNILIINHAEKDVMLRGKGTTTSNGVRANELLS